MARTVTPWTPGYVSPNLEYGLANGMAYHFTFMWFFAINGFCYVLYTFVSGEGR